MEVEDLWQNIHGPSSLVELALNQPEVNSLLVDLHIQLCSVMWAIMAFQLKSVKVLGLFDFRSKAIFFKELSYAFKPSQTEPDLGLLNTRREVSPSPWRPWHPCDSLFVRYFFHSLFFSLLVSVCLGFVLDCYPFLSQMTYFHNGKVFFLYLFDPVTLPLDPNLDYNTCLTKDYWIPPPPPAGSLRAQCIDVYMCTCRLCIV